MTHNQNQRVYGLMCARNEADRYLAQCLRWNMRHVDALFVYDDQSEDDSLQMAVELDAVAECRPNEMPSFMESESGFREAAWRAFEARLSPGLGDTVVALDADEFLVHDSDQAQLHDALATLNGEQVKIIEVFGIEQDVPQIRVDGFWDTISAPRVFRYEPHGHFTEKKMGGGSVPSYVRAGGLALGVSILHFGYAKSADRAAKFERYHDRSEHNHSHVLSILTRPQLVPWGGVNPCG